MVSTFMSETYMYLCAEMLWSIATNAPGVFDHCLMVPMAFLDNNCAASSVHSSAGNPAHP